MRPFDRQKLNVVLLVCLTAIAGAVYLYRSSATTAIVYITKTDLPIYYRIDTSDVITSTVSLAAQQSNFFPISKIANGQYTRRPIKAGQPLLSADLIPAPDPSLTNNTVPVSIQASSAMVYNGHVESGSVVTVWAVHPDTGQTKVILDKALVLDVQEADSSNENEPLHFGIILAVPIDKQSEILSTAASNALGITLNPPVKPAHQN